MIWLQRMMLWQQDSIGAPPLALVEAISTIIDIEKLCEERLEPKIVDKIKTQQLLTGTERSRYDYRKFVLAKR